MWGYVDCDIVESSAAMIERLPVESAITEQTRSFKRLKMNL